MEVMPTLRVLVATIAVALSAMVISAQTSPSAANKSADKNGDRKALVPVVIELFTSEGCSSCPPADDVLAMMVKEQPVPGAQIIGLGEHVDYWDRLGWRDQFSSADFTARQNDYASRAFHTDSIYTPQLIVNGAEQVVGSDARKVKQAIAKAAQRPSPITLAVTISPDAPDRTQIPVQIQASLAAGA